MRYRVSLILRRAEGALLRVLGLAERRGFTIEAVQCSPVPHQNLWQIAFTVSSERLADPLKRQLEKLYDCVSVDILLQQACSEEQVSQEMLT